MKRFASLTSRLVVTDGPAGGRGVPADRRRRDAGAALLPRRAAGPRRARFSCSRLPQDDQGPITPPDDDDRDNHPFDLPRTACSPGCSRHRAAAGPRSTDDDGADQLDSATIAHGHRSRCRPTAAARRQPAGIRRVPRRPRPDALRHDRGRAADVLGRRPGLAADPLGGARRCARHRRRGGRRASSWYAASCGRCARSRRPRTTSPSCRSPPATSSSPSGCPNGSPTRTPRSARSARPSTPCWRTSSRR